MRLDESQQRRLVQKLNELFMPPQECCVCKNTSWSVSDVIWELREFQGGSLVIGGDTKLLPVVAMSCNKCGYTVFLNAMLLGVIEAPKTGEASASKPGESSDERGT